MLASKIHDKKETPSPLSNDPIFNEMLLVAVGWANKNLKLKSQNLIELVTLLMTWVQKHKEMKGKGSTKKQMILEVVKTVINKNMNHLSESDKQSLLFFADMILPQTIETILNASSGLLKIKRKWLKCLGC